MFSLDAEWGVGRGKDEKQAKRERSSWIDKTIDVRQGKVSSTGNLSCYASRVRGFDLLLRSWVEIEYGRSVNCRSLSFHSRLIVPSPPISIINFISLALIWWLNRGSFFPSLGFFSVEGRRRNKRRTGKSFLCPKNSSSYSRSGYERRRTIKL